MTQTRKRPSLAAIVAIVACLVAGAALALAIIIAQDASGTRASLQTQIGHLRASLSAQASKEAADYGSMQNTVAGLSNPADPLSAYDQICHSDFTNDQTGALSTYYYPCTNNVQTIPQPGG